MGLPRSIISKSIAIGTYRPVLAGLACPAQLAYGGLVGYPETASRRRSPGQQA